MNKKVILLCSFGIVISVSSAIISLYLKSAEPKYKGALIVSTKFSVDGSKIPTYGKTHDLENNFEFLIPPLYVNHMSRFQNEGKRCLFFNYEFQIIDGKQVKSNYKLSADPQYGQRSCRT